MSRPSRLFRGRGERPRPPIRIGFCVGAFVYPQTAASLFSLGGLGPLDWIQGAFIDVSREEIAQRFYKECDEPYLLFVDSDQSFDRTDAEKLIDAMEWYPKFGAVMGLTVYRDERYKPVLQWADDIIGGKGDKFLDGKDLYRRTVRKMKEKAIEEVDWIGTGFTIIRREVFKDLEEPFFRVYHDKNKNLWGEDVHFIQAIKEAGWKVGVHFGTNVGHIGPYNYEPKTLLDFEEEAERKIAATG